jgi:serine/threonine-protein kinase
MGERLGRYAVLKHLASGGMADVLLGRTAGIEGFERHVVLKRIRAEHAKDQRFIQMFLDEARVAANLHHQNIVQVYDIGEANGEYFFAMEYLHGEDLRKLLSAVSKTRGHMPLGLVCAIVSAAASGLHYAHERRDNKQRPIGIVHRDVSPSNILIGYDGAVKVVDFGIAKAATRQVETRSGSLKGKVSYMSPEQCKGEDIDRRSDVFALGVLVYELATTTRLFKGENDYLVMDAIVNGKVPLPRVRRPDLPNDLSAIIMKALSTERHRRYQSAEELRLALDTFAIKHNLTASTSALATYMHKMFGARPEPWLENAPVVAVERNVDVDGPTQASGHSWTELAREAGTEEGAVDWDAQTEQAKPDQARSEQAKTTTGRKARRSAVANAAAVADTMAPPVSEAADTIAPPISRVETQTSLKMGWESRGTLSLRGRSKLLWVGAPLLVIIGLGVWRLTWSDEPTTTAQHAAAAEPALAAQPPPAAASAAAAPAAAAPSAAAPAPTPAAPADEVPTVRIAGAEPAPAPAAAVAEPTDSAAAPPAKKATRKSGSTAKPEKLASTATAPAAAPPAAAPPAAAPPAAAPPAAAPPAAAAPAPAPAPPAAPTPTPAVAAPEPKEVEIPMATLSNATVSGVASDHSRQLAQCEGNAELHGDVAVAFQIDANGKVVKSQLTSSIKNPKVAGCILKAVQSWKFPRPPSGSAKGVYSISYQ